MWLEVLRKFNTMENLQIRRGNKALSLHLCAMCLVNGGDNDHCSFTRELWGKRFMISGDHCLDPRRIEDFLVLMVVEMMLLCNCLVCLVGEE